MNAPKSTANANAIINEQPSQQQDFRVPSFSTHETATSISSDALKEQDPFLYFSNQERRMSYLTHNAIVAAAEHQGKKPRVEERKTCISFELHPDLLLEDLLLDDDDTDDGLGDDDLLLRLALGIPEERKEDTSSDHILSRQ